MDVDLAKLNTRQLAAVGDALIRNGNPRVAEQIYRQILRVAPHAPHIHARLGLALAPNSRTPALLAALEALEPVTRGNVFVGEGLATWFKTLPFLDDPRFTELADRHARLLPVPNWHWNLQVVVWALQQVRELDGDFMELGVFRGHTTLFAAEYLEFAGWPKTWWLYDTFEGVPDDQVDAGWNGLDEVYSKEIFSFDVVRDRFSHIPNIRVIEGRVPEILGEAAPEKIAFLHMDLNNATAEIQALDLLFDRIVPGGVIVFDDYGWAVARAQHEAEKAWFAARGLVILPLPTGQGVFVKH